MTMRAILLPIATCAVLALQGQVRSDQAIVLEGTDAAARTVQGVKDPSAADEAMNARTLQGGGYLYAEVSGDAWQAELQPAGLQPTAGLRLLLHAATGNTGPVSLSVNGSAPAPVVKDGGQPLAPGDVVAGVTASVVHDGTAFQLISARRIDRKPCPGGTVAVNEMFCIETTQHDSVDFQVAVNICGAQGMKLCSWAQYFNACWNAGALGITDLTGDWEWTDDTGNSPGSIRVVGVTSCTHASVGPGWDVVARFFHCCFER